MSLPIALLPEIAIWAIRNNYHRHRDGYVYRDISPDRQIRLYQHSEDQWEMEVVTADDVVNLCIDGDLGRCTSAIRWVTKVIRLRHDLANVKRSEMIAALRGLTDLERNYLRRDLGLRDQLTELLVESIADTIRPDTKSMTCEDAVYRLKHIRSGIDGEEVIAKVHGPELEKLRKHFKVAAGSDKLVRHNILNAAIDQEA